ncbi:MAG: PaaI family thioesterase [Deltaproteobacteria bacterium]|nr:MAG: PaaI family thioesterase [Deltaproteobacteria bacterium]
MAADVKLPEFSQEIADRFMAANDQLTGLPEFLGLRITEITPGRLTAEMQAEPRLHTPFGNMHGGVLSAMCDHVLGCVCYPHMKPGQWAATTEFKINLLAPVTEGTVRATAHIVSMTRSTAVVRIDVENQGRLCGLAQGTVLIRDPKK